MKSSKSQHSWSAVISRSKIGEGLIRRCVRDERLWAMQVDSEDVIDSQCAMLAFKKDAYLHRLTLNRTLGGRNPAVDHSWLRTRQ